MAKKRRITAAKARKLLRYNRKTGELIWRHRVQCMFRNSTEHRSAESQAKTWNERWAGKLAGWLNPKGYRCIAIECKTYREHHIIWLIVHKEWPKDQIDHKNGNRKDNRILNLREATNSENHQNSKKKSTNTSGFTGVSWHKQMHKWVAYISVSERRISLGLFIDKKDAYAAYLVAKKKYHCFQPVPREC